MNSRHKEILLKYLPEESVEPVLQLISQHKVNLKITGERKSKHGDFRPPVNGRPARITVNHNLNPYAFLLTFLHELAHQLVWDKYQRQARPHGPEWQQSYQNLMQPFLTTKYFPQDVLDKLIGDDKKIFASTYADTALARVLKAYNSSSPLVLLENLDDNACFQLRDGRHFKKLKKRRKNYLCLCTDNQRYYVFHPLAEVIPTQNPSK